MLQLDPAHSQASELKEEILRRRKNQGDPVNPAFQLSAQADGANDGSSEKFAQAQSVGARLLIVEEIKRRKEYQQALVLCDKVLTDSRASASELAWGKILKGEILGCLGEQVKADAMMVEAESDSAFGYRALCGRGALAASLSKWDEAESFFRRVLLIKPDYDAALAGLGICAQAKNHSEEAWDFYEVALRMNPENIQALTGMIPLAYSMGRLCSLEAALRAYLEIVPADLPILYSLAGCLFAQGKNEEAEEKCRNILLFEPQDERVRELLGMIEQKSVRFGNVAP